MPNQVGTFAVSRADGFGVPEDTDKETEKHDTTKDGDILEGRRSTDAVDLFDHELLVAAPPSAAAVRAVLRL